MKTRAVHAFNHNRVFGTDGFYPYQKRGWRAQRAGLLVARDGIQDAPYNFDVRIQGRSS
jgi:hypothetical protein